MSSELRSRQSWASANCSRTASSRTTSGRRSGREAPDTARGTAREHLHRLFQPFERFGAEQTEVEGTGLGLALTKGLVHAMGGDVGAESRLGSGSRFWIDLDLVGAPI